MNVHPTHAVGTTKSNRSKRVVAGVLASALALSSLTLSPLFSAPAQAAGSTGTYSVTGWFVDTASTTAAIGSRGQELTAPMIELNDKGLFTSANTVPTGQPRGGYIGSLATDGVPPTTAKSTVIGVGNGSTRLGSATNWNSTLALDANTNGHTDRGYLYAWAYNGNADTGTTGRTALESITGQTIPDSYAQTLYRFAAGETKPMVSVLPTAGHFESSLTGSSQWWSGGEVIQSNGKIFLSGAECTSLSGGFRMMIWDPKTGEYNYSGKLVAKTTADAAIAGVPAFDCGGQGYVASDMALDANGNAYILVQSSAKVPEMNKSDSTNTIWLLRVVPSTTGNWTYNIVQKLRATPGLTSTDPAYRWAGTPTYGAHLNLTYGMAFYQGMLYVYNYDEAFSIIKVNPMSGYASTVGTASPTYVQDLASGQTAYAINGTVYNDANADGTISSTETGGLSSVPVALYMKDTVSGNYILEGTRYTDASGDYTFLVGGIGDYIVRLVQPQIKGYNAVQTWASGGGTTNKTEAQCRNGNNSAPFQRDTSIGGATCYGTKVAPFNDPAYPASLDTAIGKDTSTQPADMTIYTTVSITTDKEVATADFGVTALGSYGDSPAGPADSATSAPVHSNGATPSVWLGDTLGQYDGPAADATAHATDDGVWLNSYNGKIDLNGTIFAASKTYPFVAQVSGDKASEASVNGWTTDLATKPAWVTTPKWTPNNDGTTATGDFTYQASTATPVGPTAKNVQFRVDASIPGATQPTNVAGEYQSATGNWVTPGEIEDYAFKVADSSYRVAAKTTGGNVTVTLAGAATLTAGSTAYSYGPSSAAAANTATSTTLTMPSDDWTVSSVSIKDVVTGDVVAASPTISTVDRTTTIGWTPGMGDDVLIDVILSKNASPDTSTLTVSPNDSETLNHATTGVNSPITARATIKDAEGNLLSSKDVTFETANPSLVTFVGGANTCTTTTEGYCEVQLTSSTARTYIDELSAKVGISGTQTAISGSPATLTYTAGEGIPGNSSLIVTGPGGSTTLTTVVGTGAANTFTATTTVKDASNNLVPNQTVTYSVTRVDGTAINPEKTALSATACQTGDDTNKGTCAVTLTSKEAGDFKIWATIADPENSGLPGQVTYSPVTVTYVADKDNPSIATSELVVTPDPEAAPVGVGGSYTATVTVKDQYENLLTGVDVTFDASGNASVVEGTTCTTGGNGTCVVTVTDEKAEVIQLTAMVSTSPTGPLDHVKNSPASLEFIVGEPDPDQSSLALTPQPPSVVVGNAVTGTVTIQDAKGNPVSGKTVALTVTGQATFGPIDQTPVQTTTCLTDRVGQCAVSITDKKAETVSVTATVPVSGQDRPITGSGSTATFTADVQHPDLAKSTFNVPDPKSASVGGSVTGTATVVDKYDNPLDGVTVTFGTTKSSTLGDLSAAPLTSQSCVTIAGVCVATVSDNKAEVVEFTAKVKPSPAEAAGDITGSPASVTFIQGLLDPGKSTFTVTQTPGNQGTTTPIANGTDSWTGTLVALDSQENALDDIPLTDFTFGASSDDVVVSSVTHEDGGKYIVTFTSTVASDAYVARAWYAQTRIGTDQPIPFVAGPVCVPEKGDVCTGANKTKVWVSTDNAYATGADPDVITAEAYDANGNPVAGTVFDLDSQSANLTLASATITTGADGTGTVNATSTQAISHSVRVSIGGTELTSSGSPAVVTFRASDVSETRSTVTVDKSTTTVDEKNGTSFVTVTATAKDSEGNTVPDATIAFTVTGDAVLSDESSSCTTTGNGQCTIKVSDTKAEGVTLTATVGGKEIKNVDSSLSSPKALTFTADSPSAQTSVLSIDNDNAVSVANGSHEVKVTLKDRFGNTLADSSNTVEFALSSDDASVTSAEKQSDGTYTASVTSAKEGSYNVTATLDGTAIGSTGTPTVVVARFAVMEGADPTKSTLTVDNESQTVGDEVAGPFITATATAVDSTGVNKLSGVRIDFTIDGQAQLSADSCVTGADGTCTVSITDTRAEVVNLTAKINGTEITNPSAASPDPSLSSPKTLTFIAGAADPSTSTVTAESPKPAGGTSVVTATVNDLFGNPVIGTTVSFAVDGSASFLEDVVSCTSANDGICTVAITDDKAETVNVTGTMNSTQIGSPVPVTFTATNVDPKQSHVTVSPTSTSAGSPVIVTVTLRDATQNPLTGRTPDKFDLSGLSANGVTAPNLEFTGFKELADGVYTWQTTSQVAATFTVRATVEGVLLDDAPTATFTAGGVCSDTSATPAEQNAGNVTRFAVTLDSQLANGKAEDVVTAFAYDCFGNPVENATVVATDKTQTSDLQGKLAPQEQIVHTNAQGVVELRWTSTVVGVYSVQGSMDGIVPTTGNMNVEFINDEADASQSLFTVTPTTEQTVGSWFKLTATIHDATGNAVPNKTVNFRSESGSDLDGTSCKTGADGTCFVSVSSKLAGMYEVGATISEGGITKDLGGAGDLTKASPQDVTFVADTEVCVKDCTPVDPDHVTRIQVTKNNQVANGSSTDEVTVWAYDRYGNAIENAAVVASPDAQLTAVNGTTVTGDEGTVVLQFTSTTKGTFSSAVTIGGKTPDTSPARLTFGNSVPSADDSTLTISPNTGDDKVGSAQTVAESFTVTATIRDANKNLVDGATVTFPLPANVTSPQAPESSSVASCTTGDEGTCTIDVSSTKSGTYTIKAMLSSDELSNSVSAPFKAGAVDPSKTTIVVDPNGVLNDGVASDVVTVTARDTYGNPVPGAVAQSTPATGETSLTIQPNIQPTNTDGTTTIWYRSLVAGEHQAIVTVDGLTIPTASPVVLLFGSGVGDAGHSSWTIAPQGPLSVGTDDSSKYTLTATINDALDSPVEGVLVTFSADLPGTSWGAAPQTCLTAADGTCSVSVTSTKSGTYAFTATIINGQTNAPDGIGSAQSRAWEADEVCAVGCTPEPGVDNITRVAVTDDNHRADGNARDVATVYAFDRYGNPVPGVGVQSVAKDGTKLTVQQGISPTAANNDPRGLEPGTTTIWYSSTVAASHDADVTIVDRTGVVKTPTGSPLTVTFVPGDPDPSKSSVTAESPKPAGGTSVVTATIRDKFDNPVGGTTVSFAVDGSATFVDGVTSCESGSSDGTCTVAITDNKAETVNVTGTMNSTQIGSPIPVDFTSTAVDPKQSHVSVSPASTSAGSPVNVTVTLRDATQNPLTGRTPDKFELTGIATTGTVAPNLEFTGFKELVDGVYTWQTTSQVAATFTVRASVEGILIEDAPTATFTAGGVCSDTSATPAEQNAGNVTRFAVTLDSQLANGKAEDVVTAFAYDCFGNPVENATVVATDKTQTSDLQGKLTPQEQTVKTNAQGVVELRWTSTAAGTYSVQGSMDGIVPTTGNVNIEFINDEASAAQSLFTVTPGTEQTVGSWFTLEATIHDATGNAVPNKTVNFRSQSGSDLDGTSCKTGADGTCYVSVSSKLAGTYEVGATISEGGIAKDLGGAGDSAKASPQQVTFVADTEVCVKDCTPVNPNNVTRIQVTKDNQVADGKSTDEVTVWAYDKYGNAIENAAVVASPDAQLTALNGTTVTNDKGTVVLQFTSTTKGTFSSAVTIGGKTPDTSPARLTFGNSVPSADDSTLAITPNSGDDTVGSVQTVGESFTVTATIRDANKNLVDGATVTFPLPANVTSPQAPESSTVATCKTDENGTCSIDVSSTKSGTYTVKGMLSSDELSNSVSAPFKAGAVDPSKTTVVVDPNGVLNDGIASDVVTVTAYDQYSNPIPGATVVSAPAVGETSLTIQSDIQPTNANGSTTIWYRSLVAGAHHADVTVDGIAIPAATPVTLLFGSGIGDADHSSWTIAPQGPLSVGTDDSSKYTLTATINDALDSPVEGALVTFTVDLPGTSWGTTPQTCLTAADGTCSVTVTSTRSGTYAFTATIINGQTNAPDGIGSAQSKAWEADEVCAVGCTPEPGVQDITRVAVTTDNSRADGNARDVATVYVYDRYGNPVPGVGVQSVAKDGTTLTVQQGISPTAANGDPRGLEPGTTTIWYSSKAAGSHDADVTIVDRTGVVKTPNDSPVTVTFVPGPPVASKSTLVVDPMTQAVGKNVSATATVLDANNNPVPNVTVSLGSTGDSTRSNDTCVTGDGNNGSTLGVCSITVTDKTPEQIQVTATIMVSSVQTPIAGSGTTVIFTTGCLPGIDEGCTYDPTVPDSQRTRVEVTTDGEPAGVAGSFDEATVYLFDEFGNPVGDVVPTTTPAAATLTAQPINGTDTVSGSTVIRYASSVDGTFQAAVMIKGVEITFIPQVGGGHESAEDVAAWSSPVSLTFADVTPPAAPIITAPLGGSVMNTSNPTVSGENGTVGNTVTVKAGDRFLCTTTVQEDGTWSCDSTVSLTDGDYQLTAVQTDPSNNTSDPSPSVKITIDTQAPDAPVITVANGTAISGTAEAGSTVTLTVPGVDDPITVTADANGVWSIRTPAGAVDGTVTATATDPAGNVSPEGSKDLKTSASSPYIDTANGTKIAGTAEPGSTVTVTVPLDDGTTETFTDVQTDPVTGAWSVDTPANAKDGSLVTAVEKDAQGNTSDEAEKTIDMAADTPTIDTANGTTIAGTAEPNSTVEVTIPGVDDPVTATAGPDGKWSIPTPEGAEDGTVTAIATDPAGNVSDPASAELKTSTPDPTIDKANGTEISGTAEPNSTVTVTVPGVDKPITTTTGPDGTWSITTPEGAVDGDVTAQAEDKAGNQSDPVSVPLDVTAPDSPTIDKANGTEISGTAEPNSTVTVTVPGVDDPITTTTGPDGTWSITTPEGAEDGKVTVTATDPAGNTSDPAEAELKTSTPDPTIDTANGTEISGTAEPGSTVTVTVPGVDDPITTTTGPDGTWSIDTPEGAIDGEATAQATDPAGNVSDPVSVPLDVTAPDSPSIDTANGKEISGTAEPGSTVTVTVPGVDDPITTTTGPDGTWSIPTPEGAEDGTLTATATDPAGNTSDPVTAPLDVTAPDSPSIDTANGTEISGTAEPGSTVTVTVPGVDDPITTTTGPDGTWSIPTPEGAEDGMLTATATDPAGNTSDPVTAPLDVTAPDTPRVDTANGTEVSGGKDAAEPGSNVTVTWPDGTTTTTKVNPDGSYEVTTPDGMEPGEITVTATDPAGNVSDPVSEDLKTSTPDPTIDTANGKEISGTAEPGSTVTVTVPGVDKPVTTTTKPDGTWTITTPEGATDGTVTAQATDPAGNVSDPVSETLKTSTPDPTIDKANGTEISGTAEPGSTVTVTVPGVDKPVTTTTKPDGTWTITTPEGATDGTVTAQATDKAGNVSDPVSETLKTSTPDPTIDRANGSQIAGKAEPNSTVTVTVPGVDKPLTTTTGPDGRWSISTPAGATDGTVTAQSTDRAGNKSDPVTAPLDVTAPDAPRVDTANGTEVSGGKDAAEPGSTVRVTWPDGTTSTTTANPDGSYRFTTPNGMKPGQLELTATDPAGNVSDPTKAGLKTAADTPTIDTANGKEISGTAEPGSTVTVTVPGVDKPVTATTKPDGTWTITTPEGATDGTVTAQATDPAGNKSDPVSVPLKTSTPDPTIDRANGTEISGTAEPGSTVTVTVPGVSKPVTVGTNPDGKWSISTPAGATDGTVTAQATDPAGNQSNPVTAELDVTSPDAPRVDKANATEVSGGQGAAEPNSTVKVTWPDGSTTTTKANPDGSYKVTTPVGMKPGAITVTATDPAGNVSDPSTANLKTSTPDPTIDTANGKEISGTAEPGSTVTVTVPGTDKPITTTTKPDGTWSVTTPAGAKDGTVTAQATDPAGNKSDPVSVPLKTNTPDPTIDTANGSKIAGKAEPGTTVTVTVPGTDKPITTTTKPDGTWSITTPAGATDGGTVKAVATDKAGNVSGEAQKVIDITAPDAPRVDTANGTQVSGGKDAAEPGSTVTVTWPDGTKTTTTARPDGSYKVTTPDGMKSGEIKVTATDPAGNVSKPTTAGLDTDAPDAPRVDKANAAEVSGGKNAAEPGSTVTVTWPDGTKTTTTAQPDGSYKVTTPDGMKSGEITVTATDPAGNVSDPTKAAVDTHKPQPPVVNPSNGTEVTGTGEAGSTVNIEDGNGNVVKCKEGEVTVNSNGSWTCTPDIPLTPGTDITVSVTTPSGNESDKVTVTIGKLGIRIEYPTRHAGEQQIVYGTGFTPGERVDAAVNSTSTVGSAIADAKGNVAITFTVPAGSAPSTYTVSLIGQRSGATLGSVSTTFQVVAEPKAPLGGDMTISGMSLGSSAAIVLILLAAGVGILTWMRRKGEVEA